MTFIFRPGDPRAGAQLGGKARTLEALRPFSLSIPEWFVVLPQAFIASLPEAARLPFARGNPGGETLRTLETLKPAAAVRHELNQALSELCPPGASVAVRSSALEEDGCAHSFAGQFESFLCVRPEDVSDRVAAVWRSAFSARVRAYREQRQLSGAPAAPAVLIQRMIHADAAGVAFGADVVSGRRDHAIVTAIRGLGVALVAGEANADTWHVAASGDIIERRIAPATSAPGGGSRQFCEATKGNQDRRQAVLDDAQVRAVAALVRRAGEILGRPQDIEWAFENGQLHLLQSRPITSFGGSPALEGKLSIWDNSNLIESYSGVTTPMTFSFARRAYEGVYRQFCQVLIVRQEKIARHDATFRNLLGLIQGRMYYNLLNWYRVLALLPGFTINRRFMEQMMGVKEELPAEIVAELGRVSLNERLQDGLNFVFSFVALATNHFLLPRKIRRFYVRLNAALAPTAEPIEAMTAEELSGHFLELERKLLNRWDAPLINDFFAMVFHGLLRRLAACWLNDESQTNRLVCGDKDLMSAEPARRIGEMAQLAATDASFVEQLCVGPLDAIVATMSSRPKFQSAYFAYLARFGDRCFEELKLESLTLHDDPLPLLRSVGRLARSQSPGPRHPTVGAGQELRDADGRVGDGFEGQPMRRVIFHWVLRQARARVRDRENLRFERTRLFGRVRRLVVELGRRLHKEGHLQGARDVFFLGIDEVLAFISGTATSRHLKQLVALRQAEFATYRASPPLPNRFTTRGLNQEITSSPGSKRPQPTLRDHERTGIGCSAGVVRGRVRKIHDPRGGWVQQGEILVAEHTDPGWVMLFPAAAGLLVERGSLLSHSAIVARELHLPAIVSIDGLTTWLRDGDEVEFDGTTGVVHLLARADEVRVGRSASLDPSAKRIRSTQTNARAITSATS